MIDVTVQMEVVQCYGCGMTYAIPDVLHRKMHRLHEEQSIYCPLGHTWFYMGKSEAKQIQELKLELQQRDNDLEEQRGRVRRLEKRVTRGICIYCKRTFPNIARHMECKHPEKP